jgi:hypothetical protein
MGRWEGLPGGDLLFDEDGALTAETPRSPPRSVRAATRIDARVSDTRWVSESPSRQRTGGSNSWLEEAVDRKQDTAGPMRVPTTAGVGREGEPWATVAQLAVGAAVKGMESLTFAQLAESIAKRTRVPGIPQLAASPALKDMLSPTVAQLSGIIAKSVIPPTVAQALGRWDVASIVLDEIDWTSRPTAGMGSIPNPDLVRSTAPRPEWLIVRRQIGLALLILMVALMAETRAALPGGVADDVNNLLLFALGGPAVALLGKRR